MRLIEITMGSTNGNGWCTISKAYLQIYDEYHHLINISTNPLPERAR